MSELVCAQKIQTALRSMDEFDDTDVVINDNSILDDAAVNAPYAIIYTSDSFLSEQMTVKRMRDQITSGTSVTPSDIRRFFSSIPKDSLPYFSEEVTVGQQGLSTAQLQEDCRPVDRRRRPNPQRQAMVRAHGS